MDFAHDLNLTRRSCLVDSIFGDAAMEFVYYSSRVVEMTSHGTLRLVGIPYSRGYADFFREGLPT